MEHGREGRIHTEFEINAESYLCVVEDIMNSPATTAAVVVIAAVVVPIVAMIIAIIISTGYATTTAATATATATGCCSHSHSVPEHRTDRGRVVDIDFGGSNAVAGTIITITITITNAIAVAAIRSNMTGTFHSTTNT